MTSLQRAIESLPHCPKRPQEFAREVGVNKDISSRLFSAIRSRDSLAAVHRLPGSSAMRQVLAAVEARGANVSCVRGAEESLRAFDEFVREQFDDRAGLDAIIGASLPGARKKFEATCKQTMYRGTVGLKGVTSDAILVTFLTFPTPNSTTTCDTSVVNGFVGLRRVRPGAVVQFQSHLFEPEHTRTTLDGAAVVEGTSPLLSEFCSPPNPPLSVRPAGIALHYELNDIGVGPRTATDIFLAEYYKGNHPRVKDRSKPGKRWYYAAVDHPTKLLLLDLLIHEDMWRGCDPELRLYDTILYGSADPNDPGRNKDRLDLSESVASMGSGLDRFRCEEIPNYRSILAHMFDRIGQDGSKFRGYRCRIPYPFYGSQVCMLFDPPDEAT